MASRPIRASRSNLMRQKLSQLAEVHRRQAEIRRSPTVVGFTGGRSTNSSQRLRLAQAARPPHRQRIRRHGFACGPSSPPSRALSLTMFPMQDLDHRRRRTELRAISIHAPGRQHRRGWITWGPKPVRQRSAPTRRWPTSRQRPAGWRPREPTLDIDRALAARYGLSRQAASARRSTMPSVNARSRPSTIR